MFKILGLFISLLKILKFFLQIYEYLNSLKKDRDQKSIKTASKTPKIPKLA